MSDTNVTNPKSDDSLENNIEPTATVASIDVGLKNLGLVVAEINIESWTVVKILCAQRIDLTQLAHVRVHRTHCKLHHTNDACDRVMHFCQEYNEWLENASVILIERQPITGLVHVEQLLYNQFRNKAILQSPRSMHVWLGISHVDYDGRKEYTTAYTKDLLSSASVEKDRLHDIADAACFLLFWLDGKQRERQRAIDAQFNVAAASIAFKAPNTETIEWLEGFRYRPKT